MLMAKPSVSSMAWFICGRGFRLNSNDKNKLSSLSNECVVKHNAGLCKCKYLTTQLSASSKLVPLLAAIAMWPKISKFCLFANLSPKLGQLRVWLQYSNKFA